MPIQKEELIKKSKKIIPIKELISEDDLTVLLEQLNNLPRFLKEAIYHNKFAVIFQFVEGQDETDNAQFKAAIANSASVSDFIKIVLFKVDKNYFGQQQDNQQKISDYTNYMNMLWSNVRSTDYPQYILCISSMDNNVKGGFSDTQDHIIINYCFNSDYDDYNNIACVLSHELTHAIDYNRDKSRKEKFYDSCSQIEDTQINSCVDILHGLGVKGVGENFLKNVKLELITYTVQHFLANKEILDFQIKLLQAFSMLNLADCVQLINKSIDSFKENKEGFLKDFLEEIQKAISDLQSLKVQLHDPAQQNSIFEDSGVMNTKVLQMIPVLSWMSNATVREVLLDKNKDQKKEILQMLHSELPNSNGFIGIWFLGECLKDPASVDEDWEKLDPQEQLQKYTSWLDKLLKEKEAKNPYMHTSIKFKSNIILMIKYFEKRHFDGSKQIAIKELVNRLHLLLLKNDSERDLVAITEESEFSNIKKEFKEIEFELIQQDQLQQEVMARKELIKEESIARVELLYEFLCKSIIYNEQLDREDLNDSQLRETIEIALIQIKEFFGLLQKAIEQEPSEAQKLFIKFEEIIRIHEQQIAKIGVKKIHFAAIIHEQQNQLAIYKRRLEESKRHLQQSAPWISYSNRQDSQTIRNVAKQQARYQQATISSANKQTKKKL